MQNILLTGASGFIGSKLVNMLNETKKYNVIVLGSKKIKNNKFVNHLDYTFTKASFYENNIKDIDIVIHLGAFTPKNNEQANDLEGSLSNINNSYNLLNELPCIPKKVIFASTLDVYDPLVNTLDENTSINPVSLYGQSKIYCENMFEIWARKNNVQLQILRIGHIYGEGEEAYRKVIPIAIQNILNGYPPVIFTDGMEKRAFLHVEDCCSLIIKSLELEEEVGPINLVSGFGYTIKEIIDNIIELCETDIQPNVLNQYKNARSLEFNNSKMSKILGCETIDLKEGLSREIQYFRSKIGKVE